MPKTKSKKTGHGPMARTTEKSKDFKGTMKKLIKYLAPYKFTFLFGIIAAVVSVIISVIGPKIIGNLITEVAEGYMRKVQGTGGIDFDNVDHADLRPCICSECLGSIFASPCQHGHVGCRWDHDGISVQYLRAITSSRRIF